MVEGIPSIKFSNVTCKGCVVGKHAEHIYEKGNARRVVKVIDLVHSYLIGPLPTPHYGKLSSIFTFIDYFSRYYCVYFLKLKSKVFENFKVYKSLVENACGNNINVLRN